MWPPLNLLHPATADSLLQYRLARLAGARAKASSYTPPFSGSMFPWESAFTGEEVCPISAPTGLREIHINGDIAIAVNNFWIATQDNSKSWLNVTAYPIVSSIADFWMSKLALDNIGASAGSPLSLLNVIPPDEYADHKNNSVFTNVGAVLTLRHAATFGAILGEAPSRLAPWIDAAARIVVPFNTSLGGWHPEYDGYVNGTTVKQADAILLGFPIGWPMSAIARANDLNLYASVTDKGGPAMTWGSFAIGYIELGVGYQSLASLNFNRSFANAHLPYNVWTETPTGGCSNFLTGAGGFLQTALFGYTKMRVNESGITLSPSSLPEFSSLIRVRGIAYLGARLDMMYNATILTVERQVVPPPNFLPLKQTTYAPFCTSNASTICEEKFSKSRNAQLEMLPGADSAGLAARSQRGRVSLRSGKWIVDANTDLELVDAKGSIYALTPGVPIYLPLQAVSIRAVN
jgi:trehalose/maltose hydrolase-like predicted phosphorylase